MKPETSERRLVVNHQTTWLMTTLDTGGEVRFHA